MGRQDKTAAPFFSIPGEFMVVRVRKVLIRWRESDPCPVIIVMTH